MRDKPQRLAAAALLLFALASLGAAQSAPGSPAPPAVERALGFLEKEAYRWKAARQCAGCHHAAMVVWSFNEARARGYAVNEPALKEITAWTVENTKTNVAVPQAPPRDVINLGAVYALLSLETAPAQPEPIPADLQTLVKYIVGEQEADGAWGLPLDERAPLGGPVEDIAILSRIALLQSGDDSTTVAASIQKAGDWLEANSAHSSRQSRNLRLLMNLREGKPAEELAPVVASIKAEQNADGGWSQTSEMASDAYATGQTLYVLARAGVKPEDPQMARGVEFLTKSQHEDGSWPMISRVNSKDMTPITAAGAAWAVLGLVRGLP